MSGPPPRPQALRVLRGNPGKHKIRDEPKPNPSPLDPPKWLKGDHRAVKIWAEEVPRLLALGLIGDIDRLAFSALCERAATYQRCARAIRKVQVQMTKGGISMPMAESSIARTAVLALDKLCGKFGMTPADRARITAASNPGLNQKWQGLVRR